MKMKNLFYSVVALGVLLSGCTNKHINSEVNTNSEFYNEILVGLSECSEKTLPFMLNTSFNFMGEKYDNDDRYNSKFKICRVNSSEVAIELSEDFKIDNDSFTNTSEETVILQECGKEKPMFSMSKKFSICKRTDGLTQVRVYRNLN